MYCLKRKKIKSLLILVGSLLILICGIGIISYKYINTQIKNKEDYELIEDFMREQENKDIPITTSIDFNNNNKVVNDEAYLGIVEIPKINVKRGFFDKNSKKNKVSKNVEIIKESNMPDVEYGNLILAAHCGRSSVAYFDDLPKLKSGDEAIIHYNGKKYIYELKNRYEIPKTGKANIQRNLKRTTLTLITCKHLRKKQIIFIFELKNIIESEKYYE